MYYISRRSEMYSASLKTDFFLVAFFNKMSQKEHMFGKRDILRLLLRYFSRNKYTNETHDQHDPSTNLTRSSVPRMTLELKMSNRYSHILRDLYTPRSPQIFTLPLCLQMDALTARPFLDKSFELRKPSCHLSSGRSLLRYLRGIAGAGMNENGTRSTGGSEASIIVAVGEIVIPAIRVWRRTSCDSS